jgi:hypothetical protein
MIPIKLECECGQHYTFDVEPVNGRMPTRVACPNCGSDGTAVANDTIARQLPSASSPIVRLIEPPPSAPVATATSILPDSIPSAIETTIEPPAAPPALSPMRLAVAASSPQPAEATRPAPARRPDPRLGLVDRNQAEHEARAQAMWGDTKEQIVSYLMIQGFSVPEANELATKLFKERAAAVRSNGIRKIIIGTGLMCVPVIALLIFLYIHIIPLKPFAITVMIGLYGFWLFVNGILMAVAPKSERGDVADQ